MRLGKHQLAIIAVLRDGAELYNDAGMWGMRLLEGDTSYSGRVPASSCRSLLMRGLIYEKERQAGMGYAGAERVVYSLSERGRDAI
jgi:hypothetical protein